MALPAAKPVQREKQSDKLEVKSAKEMEKKKGKPQFQQKLEQKQKKPAVKKQPDIKKVSERKPSQKGAEGRPRRSSSGSKSASGNKQSQSRSGSRQSASKSSTLPAKKVDYKPKPASKKKVINTEPIKINKDLKSQGKPDKSGTKSTTTKPKKAPEPKKSFVNKLLSFV